jgi:hypothetical protein
MLSAIADALALVATGGNALQSVSSGMKDLAGLVRGPDVEKKELEKLVIDLADRLLHIQPTQIAVKGALLDLQDEVRRVERFQGEAKRYVLEKTDMGSFVYQLKRGDEQGEPLHCLCTACYEKQVKSILQPAGFNTLGCPNCGAKFLKSDGRGKAVSGGIETGYDILNPYSGT